jgi:predicted patatin/cPLA2 family phospholipase
MDYSYDEFCDWIWISANYTPFMSLVRKNGSEYADGGLGAIVPIEEAILRGAGYVDVVVLHTEINYMNRMPSRNPFELLTTMLSFILDRVENYNIRIGKLVANQKDAIINLYYTPTVLTTNSLIFDKEKMTRWWKRGYLYAKNKNEETNPIQPNEHE